MSRLCYRCRGTFLRLNIITTRDTPPGFTRTSPLPRDDDDDDDGTVNGTVNNNGYDDDDGNTTVVLLARIISRHKRSLPDPKP